MLLTHLIYEHIRPFLIISILYYFLSKWTVLFHYYSTCSRLLILIVYLYSSFIRSTFCFTVHLSICT